jgi:hypothetical protein
MADLDDVCSKLDDIERAVDDVSSKLDDIEQAVEKKGSWLASWWWVLPWIYLIVFVWIPDAWYSNTRYAIQYQVGYNQITHYYRPRDCSFLTSPLGNKGCRYERVVTTSQVGEKTQVFVDWLKIDDPKLVE